MCHKGAPRNLTTSKFPTVLFCSLLGCCDFLVICIQYLVLFVWQEPVTNGASYLHQPKWNILFLQMGPQMIIVLGNDLEILTL